VHVFRGVTDAPMRCSPDELMTVAVVQMSHALVDGRRATAVARELCGGTADPARGAVSRAPSAPHPSSRPDRRTAAVGALLLPRSVARAIRRGVRANRAREELAALTASGAVPPPGPGFAPTALNDGAALVSGHSIDMLVFDS